MNGVKINISLQKIMQYVLAIWLLLMMGIPLIPTIFKMGLMGILAGYGFLLILNGRLKQNGHLILGIIIWETFFLFTMINGLFNGFELDMNLIEIYLVRPIMIYLIVQIINTKEAYMFLVKALIWIVLFIAIYNLIYMLGRRGILPNFMTWENGVAIVEEGFLAIRVSNQTALIFLVPFISVFNVFSSRFPSSYVVLMRASLVLSSIAVIMSGRRALQVITIAGFGISMVFWGLNKGKTTKKSIVKCVGIVVGVVAILLVILQIGNTMNIGNIFVTLYNTIKDAFMDKRSNVRNLQTEYLLQEWRKKPFFGWGLSAYVTYFVRSSVTKWSYEHFYIALLFQIGVVGVCFVFCCVFNLVMHVYKKYLYSNSNETGIALLACLVGFLCFAVAGSTNPMITSTWIWFILIASYNVGICDMREEKGIR